MSRHPLVSKKQNKKTKNKKQKQKQQQQQKNPMATRLKSTIFAAVGWIWSHVHAQVLMTHVLSARRNFHDKRQVWFTEGTCWNNPNNTPFRMLNFHS